MEGDKGAGARENRGREGYGRREKKGRDLYDGGRREKNSKGSQRNEPNNVS